MSIILSLVLIATAIFLLHKYLTRNINYFRDRNVPYKKPLPLFGDIFKALLAFESGWDSILRVVNEFRNVPFVGFFDVTTPALSVQDPNIIKQLGIKDFESFVNHQSFVQSGTDELFRNSLFLMQDQRWKEMRTTLSPAFTGSKMRMMFDLVKKCAENMVVYCNEKCQESGVNMMTIKPRELFTKVTVNVISTCAFGLEVDCLKDPNNELFENVKKILDTDAPGTTMKFIFMNMMPKVAKWLGMSITPKPTTDFFKQLVADTIAYRRKTNTFRPDVIHLLIQAIDGNLKHDSNKKDDDTGFATIHESNHNIIKKTSDSKKAWTYDEIAGQCFIFFIAGYDTTSTLLNFAAYQLAIDPNVQEKLYEEMKETEKELDEKSITYEALMKMQYLDAFICECLRMFPPMLGIDRVCNKETTIEDDKGNKFTIPEGMLVMFNPISVHYNPKYYPNPGKFDPERFYGDNKMNIQPNTFISFGVGPRACIGKWN